MAVLIHAVARTGLAPFHMPDRFRHEIAYFMTVPGSGGIPTLPEHEYWVTSQDARDMLEGGVILVVSPLDSENKTEVELSEDHELWLEWMVANGVEHIRLE